MYKLLKPLLFSPPLPVSCFKQPGLSIRRSACNAFPSVFCLQRFANTIRMNSASVNPNSAAEETQTAGKADLHEHDSTEAIVSALKDVRRRVAAVTSESRPPGTAVQLVAVSKTKPISMLKAAYDEGQRHFGENYVQELEEKAAQMPDDINWHYIGPLQSNKAKALASIPNLYMVESIDRDKIAHALDKAVANVGRKSPLKVLVQVNTSGEDSKSGCEPDETVNLVKTVQGCENLEFSGLMTIGAFDDSEEPVAFRILKDARDKVVTSLGLEPHIVMLSMGMSNDFEAAIRMGSDSVRVGSTIFGARHYPNK